MRETDIEIFERLCKKIAAELGMHSKVQIFRIKAVDSKGKMMSFNNELSYINNCSNCTFYIKNLKRCGLKPNKFCWREECDPSEYDFKCKDFTERRIKNEHKQTK